MDGDGKYEINNGSTAIDDNGTPLYSTSLGHGDAQHLSDLDPDRPGLELWDLVGCGFDTRIVGRQ